jgi:protein-arginine deiminase
MTGGGVIDSSIGGGELELRRRAPDASFVRLLDAQRQQDAVVIDTAWLAVGHIDEIIAFVPADNKRGWKVVVADPMGAWRVLDRIVSQGGRDKPFRSGLEPWADGLVPEEITRTVGEVFDDPRLAAAQQVAQQKIAEVIATLRVETGIGDADLIRVPVLFEPTFFNERSYLALTPNAANLVPLDNGQVAVARQHGPLVGGRDVFEQMIEAAFRAEDIDVSWVEDFIQAHGGNGEIHCQSNVLRHPGRLAQWWRVK